MLAKTLYGFEDLLEQELRQLGAMDIKKGVRNVSFVGDKGFMYKANMALRTAIKILKPIRTFRVHNEQDLYDQIYKMRWDYYLKPYKGCDIPLNRTSSILQHNSLTESSGKKPSSSGPRWTNAAAILRSKSSSGCRPPPRSIVPAIPHI